MISIKKIFTTDIVKVSSLNAISTLIKMLSAFISVKVVAALIGPAGIALLGQLNNFTTITQSIANGGINAGITKYTAQYSNSERRYTLFLSTGVWITVILSIVTGLVLIINAHYFSIEILKDIQYKSIFYIFGCTLIFYSFNALLIAVINGFKEYNRYVLINILSSIIGLIFSVVLALGFGLYGALVATVTYQSVILFITVLAIIKLPWFKWKIFLSGFNKLAAYKLSHYSLMALATAIIVPLSQLIVRSFIVKHVSISDAGLWEGINRISNIYLLVVTTSLSVYYLPRLSELKNRKELRHEVLKVYKLVVPFLLIASSLIFLFKSIIIRILFTPDFASMQNLFAYQLLGDIFKMSGWVLGFLLIAKAATFTYIVLEVLSNGLFIGLSLVLIPSYGTIGAVAGYAFYNFVYLIAIIIFFRKLLFTSIK